MPARLTKLLVLALLALAVTASAGSAASPARTRILGVVPHRSQLPLPLPFPALSRAIGAAGTAGPATLTFDASYETLINQYFTDVAHDSGGVQNVYSIATQYGDTSGLIQYRSTFAGSYVDHDPLPANGCSDGVDAYCLTDQQLEDEIQSVLTAKGWHGGLENVFFLLTPNGVGSCVDGSTNECSTNHFCAYHSAFLDSNSEDVIYANEPYEGPSPGCTGPDQGFPNNDVDAETTIDTISHEHNEAITDPLGNGWLAADGNEEADLCAYGFGTPLGGTLGTTAYNQVINAHHYDLQQDYSNGDGGCVQHYPGGVPTPTFSGTIGPLVYRGGPVLHASTTYAIYWLPTPGSASAPVVTGTAAVKKTLKTSAGTWTGAPTGFRYQWQRCSPARTHCASIPGATAATYKLKTADGGHTLRSTVTAGDVNGISPPTASATTARVTGVPAVRKAPHISGRARIGKKLSAGRGSWTYSPKRYRYQWIRCNGHGGRCRSIRHATRPKYELTKRDARHRLRVRVTAVNAAGTRTAISRASGRVPGR